MNYQLVFAKAVNHWKAGKLSDRELNCYITGAFNAFSVVLSDNSMIKQYLTKLFGLSETLDNQLRMLKIPVKSLNPHIEEIKGLISRFNPNEQGLIELREELEDMRSMYESLDDSEMVKECDVKIKYISGLLR